MQLRFSTVSILPTDLTEKRSYCFVFIICFVLLFPSYYFPRTDASVKFDKTIKSCIKISTVLDVPTAGFASLGPFKANYCYDLYSTSTRSANIKTQNKLRDAHRAAFLWNIFTGDSETRLTMSVVAAVDSAASVGRVCLKAAEVCRQTWQTIAWLSVAFEPWKSREQWNRELVGNGAEREGNRRDRGLNREREGTTRKLTKPSWRHAGKWTKTGIPGELCLFLRGDILSAEFNPLLAVRRTRNSATAYVRPLIHLDPLRLWSLLYLRPRQPTGQNL